MSAVPNTPAWPPIFLAQLRRSLGTHRTLSWLLFGLIVAQIIALGSVGVIFGLRISHEVEAETTQTTMDPISLGSIHDFGEEGILDEGLAALWLAGMASLLLAVLWPIRVWRGEPVTRRDYHYSMPIKRSHHDLTRVLAGGVWVLLVSLGLVLVAAVTAALFDHTALFGRLTVWFWLNLLIAPLILYTLTSIVYVRAASRPSAWFWGGFWALGMALTVLAGFAPDFVGKVVLSPTLNPIRTLVGPIVSEIGAGTVTEGTPQVLGWILWSTVFAVGLWTAANTRPKRL